MAEFIGYVAAGLAGASVEEQQGLPVSGAAEGAKGQRIPGHTEQGNIGNGETGRVEGKAFAEERYPAPVVRFEGGALLLTVQRHAEKPGVPGRGTHTVEATGQFVGEPIERHRLRVRAGQAVGQREALVKQHSCLLRRCLRQTADEGIHGFRIRVQSPVSRRGEVELGYGSVPAAPGEDKG